MLNKALTETLKEFPLFRSTLKKGFFWYYLEKSNLVPVVEEENKMPCEELKDGLLFKVTYYKKRINIEVNHALTDGTGTLSFLQVLIKNYETYINRRYGWCRQEYCLSTFSKENWIHFCHKAFALFN